MTTFEEILLIYAHSLRNAQDILDLDLQMNISGPRPKDQDYPLLPITFFASIKGGNIVRAISRSFQCTHKSLTHRVPCSPVTTLHFCWLISQDSGHPARVTWIESQWCMLLCQCIVVHNLWPLVVALCQNKFNAIMIDSTVS